MRPAESRLRLPRLRRRVGSSSVRDRLTTLSRGYWRFVRKHHPSLGAASIAATPLERPCGRGRDEALVILESNLNLNTQHTTQTLGTTFHGPFRGSAGDAGALRVGGSGTGTAGRAAARACRYRSTTSRFSTRSATLRPAATMAAFMSLIDGVGAGGGGTGTNAGAEAGTNAGAAGAPAAVVNEGAAAWFACQACSASSREE